MPKAQLADFWPEGDVLLQPKRRRKGRRNKKKRKRDFSEGGKGKQDYQRNTRGAKKRYVMGGTSTSARLLCQAPFQLKQGQERKKDSDRRGK